MAVPVATDCTPRVWPACIACYSDGHLAGRWVDCADAADATLTQMHAGSGGPYGLRGSLVPRPRKGAREGCDGPARGRRVSRVYEEAGPEQWLAVCAWVSSGSHVTEGTGDLPSISDFEERFCGRWARFRDYAEDLADQTGLAADGDQLLQLGRLDQRPWLRLRRRRRPCARIRRVHLPQPVGA